jgi:hypothetical protein
MNEATMSELPDLTSIRVCRNPVFIIGSPRTGTSILAWSLHQHPDFWTSSETEFLRRLFGGDRLGEAFEVGTSRPRIWLRKQGVERAEFAAYVGLGINALFTSRSGGKRWVDQTPGYTLIVDSLAELFPSASFLHIVRDGRLVVRSMINFHRSLGKDLADRGSLPSWARSFKDAVTTYSQFVAVARTFCDRYPERSLTVVNEKISADPDGEFARIIGFLQAPYHSGPANFFRTSRINSSFQPHQWRTAAASGGPGSQSTPVTGEMAWAEWSPEDKQYFADKAGELMVSLGYVPFESAPAPALGPDG